MPAEAADASPVPPLGGLTLEQYAGITVALTEGFPLDAVLANEGMEAGEWPEAEAAWKVRVGQDGAGGPVFAAFCEKRSVAEDWLARRVEPLDDDLGAWLSFLKAWGEHPAPFELLAGAGLGMNDVARLTRGWARRMAGDEALAQQAAKLAKKGAGPLPAIRAEPGKLKPFPWSTGPKQSAPKTAAPAAGAAAGVSMLDLSFYRYVAAKAHLMENPGPGGEEHVQKKLVIADFAAVDAAWQARLQADPELERDYRRLLQHELGRVRSAAQRAEEAPRPAEIAPAPVVAAPAFAAPRVEAPRPSALAGTSLALDVPRGPALPFTPAPAPAPDLTLEQHASISCELREAPSLTAETLARYHLTAADKEALDRRFEERFAREPGLREAWERAYQTYRAWWLEQRGR